MYSITVEPSPQHTEVSGENTDHAASAPVPGARVRIAGMLDATAAYQLGKLIDQSLDVGQYRLTLLLDQVKGITSAGLMVLLKARWLLQAASDNHGRGQLTLAYPPPAVSELLLLVGLDDIVLLDQATTQEHNREQY